MLLKGKRILITGSAKRGGKAIALRLAREGAVLGIHYRSSRHEAVAVKKTLIRRGVEVYLFKGDLSCLSNIRKIVDSAWKQMGGVDILINNAANFIRTPFGRVSERDWDRILNTNLKGPFFLIQEIVQRMKKRGRGGVIMNIGDQAGIDLYPNYLPHSLSKAGIHSLTKGLVKILPKKISICAIAPKKLRSFNPLAERVFRLLKNGFKSGTIYSL